MSCFFVSSLFSFESSYSHGSLIESQSNNNCKAIVVGAKRSFAPVGVDGGEGPPVPIPNTVVKLVCVDNTRWATAREDR